MRVIVYDATLREGAQGAGAAFTIEDKLRIVEMLDDLGADYIEVGNPGSNPKDAELYALLAEHPPRHARLAAFGSTARVGEAPENDANLAALLKTGAPVTAIFGKSWDFHVREVLRTTEEENLRLIEESVRFLKAQGREVVYDAEHFFDGCKHNRDYALSTIRAAERGGADWICLCDTNGGAMLHEIDELTRLACRTVNVPIGIHCHNDTGLAVADSITAVRAGAAMAQMTLNGWGERCGNADFFTLVPDLQLKLGYDCIPPENMPKLTALSRKVSEMVNRPPDKRAPYVGQNAFAHKAGMHIDAVLKAPATFEHIPPETVGASRRILMSEMSGRSAVVERLKAVAPGIAKDSPMVAKVLEQLKELERQGYQFEGAEASFELMARRMMGQYEPFFDLREYKVVGTTPAEDGHTATAMVRMFVGGEEEITAADGYGPVNALDRAARKALERFYPQLKAMRLSDFKVRVLSSHSTASSVRVLIESTDGTESWTTVGVDVDILKASQRALTDSLEYMLLRCKRAEQAE